MDVIVAEVHDLGHKIEVKWLVLTGEMKSPTKSESTRKDNVGRIKLENPPADGIIMYFKDGSPSIELNIEDHETVNKQVKFVTAGQPDTIVSSNEELKAAFDAVL